MSTSADHYADALADVALSRNAAQEIAREFEDFMGVLRESPDLGVLLGSPAVPRESKHKVITALVERMGASQTLRNFLFVVLDRERMALLAEIQRAFEARLDERRGITRASVTSARALDDAEKAELGAALEHISKRHVEAQYHLDPALIGGTVVRIGSTIYDGSVRMQLERLRARLASE